MGEGVSPWRAEDAFGRNAGRADETRSGIGQMLLPVGAVEFRQDSRAEDR